METFVNQHNKSLGILFPEKGPIVLSISLQNKFSANKCIYVSYHCDFALIVNRN